MWRALGFFKSYLMVILGGKGVSDIIEICTVFDVWIISARLVQVAMCSVQSVVSCSLVACMNGTSSIHLLARRKQVNEQTIIQPPLTSRMDMKIGECSRCYDVLLS